MIVHGGNRHYTVIKNVSRLLKSLNATHKGAYRVCVNHLNGFRTESARDKLYDYCSSNGEVKVKMPRKKDEWLQYHDSQYQFKVLFMLYGDIESILKPLDERYRGKINQLKNGNIQSCTEKDGAYRANEVPDPLNTYSSEDW